MKMLPRLFFLVLSCTFLYSAGWRIVPSVAFASSDFSTSFNSTYEVKENLAAHVTHQISLKNLKENTYASEFSVIIGSTNLDSITARDLAGLLPVTINKKDNGVEVTVNLKSRPALGLDQTKEFTVNYESRDTVQKAGKVVEINIPKLSNSREFNSFSTSLMVPSSFGNPSIMVPEPTVKTETSRFSNFVFERNDETGISAVFGHSQAFGVNLQYFIENPGDGQVKSVIALPPDTAYQRVVIDRLDPKPQSISVDDDGNWLAAYMLKPKQKLTIDAVLTIEVKMTPSGHNLVKPLAEHLKPTRLWQSDDPEIVAVAEKLKTPREIYNYVTTNLTYDYDIAGKGNDRKGAVYALKNPRSAICTEFTDLFIALSRAAGIPARELQGFAWTENPKLRPLALSGDVLHAWPEYWDKDKNLWVQVDPTWGNTTGFIDYFTKLDFNHIVFAVHGKSDLSPLSAGFYKTDDSQKKTVTVSPKNIELNFISEPQAQIFVPNVISTYRFNDVSVKLTNQNPFSLYKIPVSVESPDLNFKAKQNLEVNLLPFETKNVEIGIKPKDFWLNRSFPVTVKIGLKIYEYQPSSSPPVKPIFGILLGSAAVYGFILAFRAGHLHFPGLFGVSNLYRKIKKS